jgi:hypothetical protein
MTGEVFLGRLKGGSCHVQNRFALKFCRGINIRYS